MWSAAKLGEIFFVTFGNSLLSLVWLKPLGVSICFWSPMVFVGCFVDFSLIQLFNFMVDVGRLNDLTLSEALILRRQVLQGRRQMAIRGRVFLPLVFCHGELEIIEGIKGVNGFHSYV